MLNLALGFSLGAIAIWLVLRGKIGGLVTRIWLSEQTTQRTEAELREQRTRSGSLAEALARAETALETERKVAAEKLSLLTAARQELESTFQALAANALRENNDSFLQLAKTQFTDFKNQSEGDLGARQKAVEELVKPIRESLDKVDAQLGDVESQRINAYATLKTQVEALINAQTELRQETTNLVRALRSPAVRGRWGEIQLKRVVEIAGMLPYCDFTEQASVTTQDGRLRPDLVVKLPGGKNVVVDAKTPLQSYLDAIETTDENSRQLYMANHARQVREHMSKLASKSYSDQFQPSPDFVVMFLPGEAFFSAAVESDATLLEEGMRSTNIKVVPASPTTLIALLRAVAYGWRQERLAQSAQEISSIGRELHERLRTFVGHLSDVKKGIDRSIEAYNRAARSLESRVLVSARRFPELGASATVDIPELSQIEATTLTLAVEEDENATGQPESGGEQGQLELDAAGGTLPLSDKASA